MPFFGSLGTFIIRTVFVVAVILNAVTTFAGTGGAGFENNVKPFNYLSGITIDSSGNLYVSDQNNNSIGKITPENVVTRLAGNGNTSSVDGSGTNATFYWPSGITIDSSGNLYVGEYAGHVVRKITPTGVVTTLAGSGTGQSLDGTGTNARFYSPNGIAIDLSGNLYVSDLNGSKLRKVTSAGVVTTLAGSGSGGYADGTGTNAQFLQLSGLTVDSSGNVFLADRLNHRIRKITSAGVVTTLAGSGIGQGTSTGSFANGTGTNASFSMPQGVAVDSSGNVYVVDGYNHRIRKVTSAGVVTTFAGNGTLSSVDGTGTNATFVYPSSILIDSSENLYIGDGNNTIRKITPSAVVTTLSATTYSNIQAQFNTPFGVATDWNGTVYVADQFNHRIRRITSAGVVTTLAGSGTPGATDGTGTGASFNYPYGVAVDSTGTVYVSDNANQCIRKITSAGVVTRLAGSGTSTFADGTGTGASFRSPSGITVDSSGHVYLADRDNNRIRKITPVGVVTTLAGQTAAGSADGTGTNATFSGPIGVVADLFGNVYVSEFNNHRIRRITSDGIVTTLAGSTVGFNDGTRTNAQFNFPQAISIDPLGVLYVAEEGGERIRKITPAGVVTTLAGTGSVGFANGTALQATFNNPHGIAVDRFRQAYVGDKDNHVIRKIADAYTLPDNNGVVTTFIGNGGIGAINNAAGIDVNSFNPHGVAVDSAGNVYFADEGAHVIRKITSTGVTTTFAGVVNNASSSDGTGTNATFGYPHGVAVDSAGNVYVISGFTKIRKITPSGVVTTLAGSGAQTFNDGLGTNASFNRPVGIAVDSSGHVYVGDTSNHRIRKITPAGVVTTFAGNGTQGFVNGTGTNATFSSPHGVALDFSGNLYVADKDNCLVRKITPTGVVTTLAGSITPGAADSTFNAPRGIAVDSAGNVYVTSSDNILKITSAGLTTRLAGNSGLQRFANGVGTNAGFWNPYGLAVDSAGIVYVSEYSNQRIRKIGTGTVQLPLNQAIVTTFAGSTQGSTNGTGTNALFGNNNRGITVDSVGNVYVADTMNNRIRRITPAGVVTTLAGSTQGSTNGTGTNATFNQPYGVAVDSAGNVYVGETGGYYIRKITPAGVVTTLAGNGGSGFADGTGTNASFGTPEGVAVDSAGTIYVSDHSGRRIRKVSETGVVTTLAGNGNFTPFADGTGTNATFGTPMGIVLDAIGNIYVADNYHKRIRRITQSGVVTTFAGNGTAGVTDGIGTNATFNEIWGVALDSAGVMYVGDTHRIRRITPDGVVTTLAGSGTPAFADGTGTNASFLAAVGVAVDSGGIVYVTTNFRIRKIQ